MPYKINVEMTQIEQALDGWVHVACVSEIVEALAFNKLVFLVQFKDVSFGLVTWPGFFFVIKKLDVH